MQTVNDYLKGITPEQRAEFERIRKIVKQIVPEAEEVISYGIPTFKYKGKYVLYFGAFKNHMSLFPGAAMASVVEQKLQGYKISKGTVQFTADKPVPESIIKEIIEHRLKTISS